MIKLENLSKVYNKGEQAVKALDNVNLTLSDSGFVFVVGKSGCGKSTLLNLIGGLDNVTEGDIVCDGNHLSELKREELDDYRNAYLGFVFQDYCLIEDLTVFQNIGVALDVKGEKLTRAQKNERIENALKSVDLDVKIKNRAIKQLSGGQKQRVAIARALIKNPKLILADEPTGNLDSKTSKTILKLLKTLSQDRLVVIVSHNQDDALTYADRIVTLSDGQVISDVERSGIDTEELTLVEGVLTLPNSKALTKEQIDKINENLSDNKIKKIEQHGDGFKKTEENERAGKKIPIRAKKISFGSSMRLAGYFLKKRIFAGLVTVVAVATLVFVLGMCQFLLQFDTANAIYTSMQENNEQSLMLHKGYFDEEGELVSNKYIYTEADDIQKFKDAGYTGNIYELYRNPFSFKNYASEGTTIVAGTSNISGIYINETYGTLVCDEGYLNKTFGYGGEIELIVGSLDERACGIVSPDYVADSVLSARPTQFSSYEDLLDRLVCERRYVNGVFKTDYKEKYADLFQYIKDVAIGLDRKADEDFFKNKQAQFIYEIQTCYGLAYSVNLDFGEAIKDINYIDHTACTFYEFKTEDFSISGDKFIAYRGFGRSDLGLGPNEIALEYDIFNDMVGETLGVTFTEETYKYFRPITLTLNKYDGVDEKNPVFSQEVTIAKLLPPTYTDITNKTSRSFFFGEDIFKNVHNYAQGVYGLFLDDASQLDTIYETIETNAFNVNSKVYKYIHIVGEIVDIFENLFNIILTGIAAVCVILLINYSYGNIKKRNYEIGVLKALGSSTKSVSFIFSLQTMIAGVLIGVCSTLMLTYLCDPINLQLSNKVLEFVGNTSLGTVHIIEPNNLIIAFNAVMVVTITAVSCLLPFVKLNRIKPKNIISNQS